jgi:hypothetical protein
VGAAHYDVDRLSGHGGPGADCVQWTLCMLVVIDTTDGKADGLYCGLTCQQQRAGGD